jgi:hypothetical protein
MNAVSATFGLGLMGNNRHAKSTLKNRYDVKRFENGLSTIPPSGSRDSGDATASMTKRATYMEHMKLDPRKRPTIQKCQRALLNINCIPGS